MQAILGCELEVAGAGGHGHHLPVLAATTEGYKNLVWLVSRAHVPRARRVVARRPGGSLEGPRRR